jgi:hypothetical protein
MKVQFIVLILLFSSCASSLKTQRLTKLELNNELKDQNISFECQTIPEYKYIRKIDFLICLGSVLKQEKQSITLNYSDLPRSGPIADLAFFTISNGYINHNSNFEFGSKNFFTKEEFFHFINVYKISNSRKK